MGSQERPERIDRLVERHYEQLYRYAYRLSGSAGDADDLVQEAFCRAQEQLGQLRDPGRARNWLFSILRNLYLHGRRAEKSHRSVPLEAAGDLPAREECGSGGEEAELQAALNELSEGHRTPIVLFYFEGFSYRDIAEQMDLPIGTVMSRLARAKAHLRERMRPAGPGSGGRSESHE